MERIDAQTIINLLLQDEKLRQQVLEAVEPVEVQRLYEQARRILERVRELEMRHAYLEQVVKELKARQEEVEERVKLAEAIVRALLQGTKKLPDDLALGFMVVRKRGGDMTLN
jgi:rubrerythrin